MSRNTSTRVPVQPRKPAGPKVLVWQQYGTTRVHPASTVGDLNAILAEVQVVTAGWHIENLGALLTLVATLVSNDKFERALREVESFFRRHNDHESFEVFEFCEIQEL